MYGQYTYMYTYLLDISPYTYSYDVQGIITHFPDFCIFIMHEIYQIGWSFWAQLRITTRLLIQFTSKQIHKNIRKDTGFLDDDLTCRLVENHLVKDIHDLTHHLIIFLLGCRHIYDH